MYGKKTRISRCLSTQVFIVSIDRNKGKCYNKNMKRRYIKNSLRYDFKFVYDKETFIVPCDGKWHSINLSKEVLDFGNYFQEIDETVASKLPIDDFGKSIILKKKELFPKEVPKETEKMSIYDDDYGYKKPTKPTPKNAPKYEGYQDQSIQSDTFNRPAFAYTAAAHGVNGINYLEENEKTVPNRLDSWNTSTLTKGVMDMAENARENDLVLAPREYSYVCDTNTGNVNVVVGPKKETLTNTDVPMRYDEKENKFVRCSLRESIRSFPSADEQSYIILKNPVTKNGSLVAPTEGQLNRPEKLESGRRVNVNGPINFPLWPGQVAEVLAGHQMRSNQYLIVKVTNADEAANNIQDATIQSKEDATEEKKTKKTKFVTGQLIIIKGTNVSFYIPPTGMEVVPDESGKYVREALTLERLEYCVLKDEEGSKRYERGPAVVFPEPTETFISRSGGTTTIFKAVELNENMGLFIKVISDYTDGKESHKAGDELFITGAETKIYFPRPEHAIIKQGKQIIHYAVLNKNNGNVILVTGPAMFLPDPRNEVIVKRVLSQKEVSLMFPGNAEAARYNAEISKELPTAQYMPPASRSAKNVQESAGQYSNLTMRFTDDAAIDEFADGLKRQTEYTPPRTITLENKYEGAVNINVWPGYAVQVMNKKGERRVIRGPSAMLLEYDETLEKLSLSTGRPKNDVKILETSYLHIQNNKVSDLVRATTSDLVDVEVELSYRVNFEDGKEDSWFNVQNYTKLLTEHLRSIIRNAIKKYGIEAFYANSIDLIRDTILGKSEKGVREGRSFSENGMQVYDVEVLNVRIDDKTIEQILIQNQHKTVQDTITLMQTRKRLELTKETQNVERQIIEEKSLTDLKTLELQAQILQKKSERDAVETTAKAEIQTTLDKIDAAEQARKKSADDRRLERTQKESEILTLAHEKTMAAITPDLVAAINNLGDKQLATALVENLPKSVGDSGAIFGIGALSNVIKMVAGTNVGKALNDISSKMEKRAD
jgi:major vault protein